MLSDTLARGLSGYHIGAKIRALRLAKNLRLAQLGKHTSLSPALLSKIERGQLFPTLPTLLRISMVFSVSLAHFFSDTPEDRRLAVTRRKQRLSLQNVEGASAPTYSFECLDFPATWRSMSGYYATFPLRDRPSTPHQHRGSELIYVVAGELALCIDGLETRLATGDAVSFDPTIPHGYRGCATRGTTAVVVVTS